MRARGWVPVRPGGWRAAAEGPRGCPEGGGHGAPAGEGRGRAGQGPRAGRGPLGLGSPAGRSGFRCAGRGRGRGVGRRGRLTWARAAGSSCWRARPAWPCSSPWPSGSSRRPAPPPGPPSWRRRRPLPPLGSAAPLRSARRARPARPGRSVGLGRRRRPVRLAPAAPLAALTGGAAPWRRLGPGPGSLRSRRDCSRAAAAAARAPEPPPPPAPPAAHSASEPARGRAGGGRRPLEAARAAPRTPGRGTTEETLDPDLAPSPVAPGIPDSAADHGPGPGRPRGLGLGPRL